MNDAILLCPSRYRTRGDRIQLAVRRTLSPLSKGDAVGAITATTFAVAYRAWVIIGATPSIPTFGGAKVWKRATKPLESGRGGKMTMLLENKIYVAASGGSLKRGSPSAPQAR